MIKVTVTIETDDQYTSVSRQHESHDAAVLLAQSISRVSETFNSRRLDAVAEAAARALTEVKGP